MVSIRMKHLITLLELQNESGCDNDAILSCCSSILARSSIGARLAGKCPTTSSQNG